METIIIPGTTVLLLETPSGMMHSAVPNKYLDTLAEASDIFTQGIPVSLINFWMGLGDAPLATETTSPIVAFTHVAGIFPPYFSKVTK